MPDQRVGAALRRVVRARARDLCEYCRSPAAFATQSFNVEHVDPRDLGGETTLENLAWACFGCNGHKHTATRGIDPETGEWVALFHPRRQRWSDHFAWSADFTRLEGKESTLVLLTGRDEPWPDTAEFRTSPEDGPFSGVSYRIEPVYQRTLAELGAKGSRLWLIFAPLAADATPEGVAEVVQRLRREVSRKEFEELSVAMTVLADADKRRRGLRDVIVSLLPEEIVMESWVFQKGVEKGVKTDVTRLFERRLRRSLSEQEQATLVRRIDALGVDRIHDVLFELPAEALAPWLADPGAT